MKTAIFGGVLGVILAIFGHSVIEEPVKTVVMLASITLLHFLTME